MASVVVVSPGPRAQVRGAVDVVVEVRLDDGDTEVGDVEIIIGPAVYGTRAASPSGAPEERRGPTRRYRYGWETTRKLVDEAEAAPGDAVFWITATADVGGRLLSAPYVPVTTANQGRGSTDGTLPTAATSGSGEPDGGDARPSTNGGWREDLAWSADLSGSIARWSEGHSAVVGARAAGIVDDPVLGAARRVLRVVVPEEMGDDPDQPTSGTVRFQASSPQVLREGDELCVGFALLLPPDFPTVYPEGDPTNPRGPEGTGYVALFQLYGPPYRQGAALVLHADRRIDADPVDELRIRGNELNPGDPEALLALPYRRGVWTDVVLRVRLSSSIADGWMETWVNQGESASVRPLSLAGVGVRVPRALLRDDSREHRTDLQVYRVRNRIPSVGAWFAAHRIARTVEEADPGSHRGAGAGPGGGR